MEKACRKRPLLLAFRCFVDVLKHLDDARNTGGGARNFCSRVAFFLGDDAQEVDNACFRDDLYVVRRKTLRTKETRFDVGGDQGIV